MARLFITPREINFINDIGKEIVKDVVGQKIYYFPISKIKTRVHDIYEEAPEKVFENPIKPETQSRLFEHNIITKLFDCIIFPISSEICINSE